MTTKISRTFSNKVLIPFLSHLAIEPGMHARIVADIEARLDSILARWSDLSFRRTILFPGVEEASFWRPAGVPLEIRSLVVMAVRNSALETLQATEGVPILPDELMPDLTIAAARFLADRVSELEPTIPPDQDVFGSLPSRFPHAWQCLSTLASLDAQQEATYQASTPVAREVWDLSTTQLRLQHHGVVVADGMSEDLDADLLEILRAAQTGEMALFLVPSFARLTRNPVKLLGVLEQLLGYGVPLVTSNYLLGPTTVARRDGLLRPAHDQDDILANFERWAGLAASHRQALRSALGLHP